MPKELNEPEMEYVNRFEKEVLSQLPDEAQTRARNAYRKLDQDTQVSFGRRLLEELADLKDWPQRQKEKVEQLPNRVENLVKVQRSNKNTRPNPEGLRARLEALRQEETSQDGPSR